MVNYHVKIKGRNENEPTDPEPSNQEYLQNQDDRQGLSKNLQPYRLQMNY